MKIDLSSLWIKKYRSHKGWIKITSRVSKDSVHIPYVEVTMGNPHAGTIVDFDMSPDLAKAVGQALLAFANSSKEGRACE